MKEMGIDNIDDLGRWNNTSKHDPHLKIEKIILE